MGSFRDLSGERFGRLLVLQRDGCNKHGQIKWWCECDCGTKKHVVGAQLRSGMTQSCGCIKREAIAKVNYKHGMKDTPIHRIWWSMMQRCHDKNSHAYARYGGRGINVCVKWQEFSAFYADMGNKPDNMSLERIDNNGDYEPSNVKWATATEQANNRRSNKFIEFDNKRLTIAQWASFAGIKTSLLWARLKRGIPMHEALQNIDRRFSKC
jgi:hypothetical protein